MPAGAACRLLAVRAARSCTLPDVRLARHRIGAGETWGRRVQCLCVSEVWGAGVLREIDTWR